MLGGTGYVAGELLRLIAAHPHFALAGVMSDSQPGEPVAAASAISPPPIRMSASNPSTTSRRIVAREPTTAIFSAAPHGSAAALIDRLLKAAEAAGRAPHVVDISADYRFRSDDAYQAVYRHPHGAPARLAQFTCAVPEHLQRSPTAHVAHPGCFATAALLASCRCSRSASHRGRSSYQALPAAPAPAANPSTARTIPRATAICTPTARSRIATRPRVRACAQAATGVDAQIAFVPHSGPFARGIHATVQASLRAPRSTADVLAALREFYAGAPFVRISDTPPHLKDIATSNYATLGAVADGNTWPCSACSTISTRAPRAARCNG